MTSKSGSVRPTPIPYSRLALAGTILGAFVVTLVGAWAEGRLPHPAGRYISLKPSASVRAAEILWQLERVDGVRDAVAVRHGQLSPDDIEGSGWAAAWFYANQTNISRLAFLPPDPTLQLSKGHLPDALSPDEALVGNELARALRLDVGDTLTVLGSPFTVSGIWSPSGHLPGNFVQISDVAAQSIATGSDVTLDLVVLPMQAEDILATASRIWKTVPNVSVISPAWELARATHERTILTLGLCASAILCVLLATPLLKDLHTAGNGSPVRLAVLAGTLGVLIGAGIVFLTNLYAGRTFALTPFQITPRLAAATVALTAGCGAMASLGRAAWPWATRSTVCALVLILCGAALATLGSLRESLTLATTEAERTAADWVTVPGVAANAALLRDVERVPAIRGYVIEALGGLANPDEERWIGPQAPSGIVYGVRFLGGEGTLTVPYRSGYWQGGPLDPEKGNQAVLGYYLAKRWQLSVGDTLTVREVPFSVVGIREPLPYDRTSDANYRIDISLDDLRRVLRDPTVEGELTLLIPPANSPQDKALYLQEAANRLNVGQLSTVEDRIAGIARNFPGTWTMTPSNPSDELRHARALYAAVFIGCAAILLASGALAVAGALEQRLVMHDLRLSLLKAFGSDEGTLLGDYVQLAASLGAAGAALAVLGGWLATALLNTAAPDRTVCLLLTPQLAAACFFLTAVSATIAAIAPVSRAIRRSAIPTLYWTSSPESVASSPELGASAP